MSAIKDDIEHYLNTANSIIYVEPSNENIWDKKTCALTIFQYKDFTTFNVKGIYPKIYEYFKIGIWKIVFYSVNKTLTKTVLFNSENGDQIVLFVPPFGNTLNEFIKSTDEREQIAFLIQYNPSIKFLLNHPQANDLPPIFFEGFALV